MTERQEGASLKVQGTPLQPRDKHLQARAGFWPVFSDERRTEMTEFDEERLRALQEAIENALGYGVANLEAPGAEGALRESRTLIELVGDEVRVWSGADLLGAWTRAELREAVRRDSA